MNKIKQWLSDRRDRKLRERAFELSNRNYSPLLIHHYVKTGEWFDDFAIRFIVEELVRFDRDFPGSMSKFAGTISHKWLIDHFGENAHNNAAAPELKQQEDRKAWSKVDEICEKDVLAGGIPIKLVGQNND